MQSGVLTLPFVKKGGPNLEVLIKDLCKERKGALNYTNQEIADHANMSVHTVNSYFSGASKAPSVYTVGPICAALGVSLDKYFGITPIESLPEQLESQARIANLEQKCRDYKKEIEHKSAIIGLKDEAIQAAQREVQRRRPIIYCLMGITALVVLAFIIYLLHFDLTNPEYGLFK